ncbi:hypothetical protein OCEANICA350_11418 [Oceanicaulis sp. 350]|nr:hypothetical protein OCEANICA350_11418 [Oceanicaulis sp. 350]
MRARLCFFRLSTPHSVNVLTSPVNALYDRRNECDSLDLVRLGPNSDIQERECRAQATYW